ncbi:MAG: endonuclease/exonuclease/phosphatase family protein [Rikenellaceae bacterium]|nr:endonuclease/exonuclease/phosphatase family protein [Rikenellaceae bacterium]
MKKIYNSLIVALAVLMAACDPTAGLEGQVEDSIAASEVEMQAPAAASTITIGVTASSTLWTASSDARWCEAQQGMDKLTLAIEENTAEERTATITLSCGTATATITITQEDGTPAPVEDAISVSDLDVVTPAAGSTVTIGVTATGEDWTAESNSEWCVATKNENSLTLTIAENTAEERTAVITLTYGEATTQIEVKQEDGTPVAPPVEDAISVADIDLSMPANAGSLKLNVTATGEWSVENTASWLTASANEEGVLVLSFQANEGAERSATVTLTCGEAKTVIKITQEEGVRIGVSPTSLTFAPEGGTLEIGVAANITWKASTKDKSWLTVTKKSDIVTVKATANPTEEERKGTVSITYTDASTNAPTSIDVEVTQSAYKVTMLSQDVVLNSDQSTATVKFEAGSAWTAKVCFAGSAWLEQIASPWATLSATEGEAGEQTLTVTFEGTDYKERVISVVATCGNISKKVNISQKSVPAPATGRKVRVMTFNQNAKGNQAIADIITDKDIDFVALQEVDEYTDRSGNTSNIETLKTLTGYKGGYFCKTIDFQGGEYGIGILSKKEALSTRFVDLPGSESRKLFIAEYDDFVFASTHFTYMSEAEMRVHHYASAQIVVKELSKYTDKPVVLGGDFNTETDINRAKTFGEIMKIMDLVSDPNENTWPNVESNDEYLLDHLFFKRDAKFPYIWTDGGAIINSASDHRPVWAELVIFE